VYLEKLDWRWLLLKPNKELFEDIVKGRLNFRALNVA
jgi:hypothetical protein